MSNGKILEKKKWIVKMIVLDAKDAEISDISHIKMYDDSSKNSTIAMKKVRNGKTEPIIEKKSLDARKKPTTDADKLNIDSKGSATRKKQRARTAHGKAENVFVQRNLRSSKKNAAMGPTISEADMFDRSMPGLSDGQPIKKEMVKMPKQSLETEKVLVSDPLPSGKWAERFSKTTHECGPSMPDLFNDHNANGISPRKNTWKFDHEQCSEKIKQRRFTIDHFTTNRQRVVQPLFQDGENISNSKVFRQEITTAGKSNTPSSDIKDPHRDLLESLAQGRKHFFENFTRN